MNNYILYFMLILVFSSCSDDNKTTYKRKSTESENKSINSDSLQKKQRDSIWNLRCIYFDSLNKKYNNSAEKNLNYLKQKDVSSNAILQFKLGQVKDDALPLLEEYCIKHDVELTRYEGVGYETYSTTDSLMIMFETKRDSSFIKLIGSASNNICMGEICKFSKFNDVIERIKLEDNGNATGYLKVSGTSLYIVFYWNDDFTKPLKVRDFWVTKNPEYI